MYLGVYFSGDNFGLGYVFSRPGAVGSSVGTGGPVLIITHFTLNANQNTTYNKQIYLRNSSNGRIRYDSYQGIEIDNRIRQLKNPITIKNNVNALQTELNKLITY